MIDPIQHILNFFQNPAAVVLCALFLDMAVGDPRRLYDKVPHPVVIVGKMISFLDVYLNRVYLFNWARFILGAFASLLTIFLFTIFTILLVRELNETSYGFVIEVILGSTLIAYRGLYDAVRDVRDGLKISLKEGRVAVSMIVGRDPKSLNEAGVVRAAVESLAENFSDGTVAPVFWFALLGLPGLVAYKVINTLDSMIGHRNDRFEYFGKFAARLDDAANFIPARLTGLLICLATYFMKEADSRAAFACLFRDARGHKSVNAGWQEAAFAGALGFSLAGPRQYGGVLTDDVWMNAAGRKDLDGEDLNRALKLYQLSGMVLAVILMGVLAITF